MFSTKQSFLESIQTKHRKWPAAVWSVSLTFLTEASQLSFMGETENLRKLEQRSVVLYRKGLLDITEFGRSGSVPLECDGHKSSLSGI